MLYRDLSLVQSYNIPKEVSLQIRSASGPEGFRLSRLPLFFFLYFNAGLAVRESQSGT